MPLRMLPWWLLATMVAGAQTPIRYARYPALSADGRRLAFEWGGDIFVAPADGGRAVAVTSHHGRDTRPKFTPDGQWVVFESARTGNTDIFKVPAAGGEPTRLTWYGGTDSLMAITADGQSAIIGSGRAGPSPAAWTYTYLLPLAGGTPTRLTRCTAGQVTATADLGRLAFVHKRSDWYWQRYKGGAAEDIWVWDRGADTYAKITDYAGPDIQPLFSPDGASIYFVTDRSGDHSLWRMKADGSEPTQLTTMPEAIRDIAIAGDGSRLVFDCDGDLWLYDVAGGGTTKIGLNGPFDRIDPQTLAETRRDGIAQFAVAPSGKECAFMVRGDLYVCRWPEGGPTRQLTNTVWEEAGVTWSEDSKTIYFQSDQYGQYDLFSLTSADPAEPRLRRAPGHTVTRLTETPEDEQWLTFSPDYKQVAYLKAYGDLIVAKPDLSEARAIGEISQVGSICWSPDSRWIAFDRDDQYSNNDVWIANVEGGKAVNVSQHPGWDGAPCWSGDMSKLAFLSDRDTEVGSRLYYVWLRRDDWLRTQADRDDAEDDAFDKPKEEETKPAEGGQPAAEGATPPEGQPAPAGEQPKPEPEPARIDLDLLHERLVLLHAPGTWIGGLFAGKDGKSIGWIENGQLFTGDWLKFEPRPIPGAGAGAELVEYSPDGKQLRYRIGGRVHALPATGGPQTAMSHEARIERDLLEERAYVFDKCWQLQRDLFYDVNMHGADWTAAREFYRPRALETPTREAFADVMNRMIGELSASHQGYSVPGRAVTPTGPPAGDLGIVWGDDRSQPGLVVDRLEPDGPGERAVGGPQPGERVLAIDGRAIDHTVDVYALLVGSVGGKVALTVRAADGTERIVDLRPMSAGQVAGYRFPNWIRANRRWVEEHSGGRVGWLQVPGMSPEGVSSYQRDLYAAANGKEALLVDVRWNGGGGSFDFILSSIRYREYTYNFSRAQPAHGFPNGWLPTPVFRGIAGALHNEGSGSGAEIFSYGMSELGLGPTFGWPTWGGVIGTGGATLVDGSSMRLPVVAYYTMGGLNMEGNPHQPEYPIDITPPDEAAGRDPQLETAVRVMLERLDAPKP